jgi:hypothetical protein
MKTFIDPNLLQRLRVGPLAPYLDAYLKHIEQEGFLPSSASIVVGWQEVVPGWSSILIKEWLSLGSKIAMTFATSLSGPSPPHSFLVKNRFWARTRILSNEALCPSPHLALNSG